MTQDRHVTPQKAKHERVVTFEEKSVDFRRVGGTSLDQIGFREGKGSVRLSSTLGKCSSSEASERRLLLSENTCFHSY